MPRLQTDGSDKTKLGNKIPVLETTGKTPNTDESKQEHEGSEEYKEPTDQ